MTAPPGRHAPATRAQRRAAARAARRRARRQALVRRGVPALAVAALALTGVAVTGQADPVIDRLKGATDLAEGPVTDLAEGPVSDLPGVEVRVGEPTGTTPTADPTETLARISRDLERARLSPEESRRADTLSRLSGAVGQEEETRREVQAAAPKWVLPVDDAPFTSGYGARWGRQHGGNDYAVDVGTPLRAMGDGRVVGAGPMGGYGVYIDIRYTDGTVSRYGHLSEVIADEGDEVVKGEIVAESGNTGRSTGPHLHLEIRPRGGEPVDPDPWLVRHDLPPGEPG